MTRNLRRWLAVRCVRCGTPWGITKPDGEHWANVCDGAKGCGFVQWLRSPERDPLASKDAAATTEGVEGEAVADALKE